MNTRRSATKLSSFTVTALWHRRLSRTRVSDVHVQPRVSAELVLHPVSGMRAEDGQRSHPKDRLDDRHAA